MPKPIASATEEKFRVMPRIDPRLLGDWIQILLGLGVSIGLVVLVVVLALSRQSPGSDHSGPAFNTPTLSSSAEGSMQVSKERQAELRSFIEENCPACHGTHLTGSIGPALSKIGLEPLSVDAVSFMILNGYQAKGMPGWNEQLSKQEAHWIAEFLKRRASSG